jgi:hypothetical protein
MTHINQRRDTSGAWADANPVLQLGEVGWETDTRRPKLGDGATPWNSLPYAAPGVITEVNGQTGPVVTLDKSDIGLGNVNNTADMDKPVSTAQQEEIVQAALLAIEGALQLAYPIGSIFMSVVDEDPAIHIGGTWVRIAEGRTIIGVDEGETKFDAAEKTGGSDEVVLTTGNLPPHTHGAAGAHSHAITARIAASSFGSAGAVAVPSTTGTVDSRNTQSDGSHTHASVGSSTPVDIQNPFFTCYIYKRIA